MGNRSYECLLPVVMLAIFVPSILLSKEYGGLFAGTGCLVFGFLYLKFEEKVCKTRSTHPIGVILIGLTCIYVFFRRLFDPTLIDDAVEDQNSWERYAILFLWAVVLYFFRHRTGETIVDDLTPEKKG